MLLSIDKSSRFSCRFCAWSWWRLRRRIITSELLSISGVRSRKGKVTIIPERKIIRISRISSLFKTVNVSWTWWSSHGVAFPNTMTKSWMNNITWSWSWRWFKFRGSIWRKSTSWFCAISIIVTIAWIIEFTERSRLCIWNNLFLVRLKVLMKWFYRQIPSRIRIPVSSFVFSLFSETVWNRLVRFMTKTSKRPELWFSFDFRIIFFVNIVSGFESHISENIFWYSSFDVTLSISSGNSWVRFLFNPNIFSASKINQCMKRKRMFPGSRSVIVLPFVRKVFQFLCCSSRRNFITLEFSSCCSFVTQALFNYMLNFQSVLAYVLFCA